MQYSMSKQPQPTSDSTSKQTSPNSSETTTSSARTTSVVSSELTLELVKYCRVCSDIASGYNFNGLSCEPCKAFFRRNAFREKDLQCTKQNSPENGKCPIDKQTRKLCSRCRLTKCFQIGMRKELIWTCDTSSTTANNEDSPEQRDEPARQISPTAKKAPSRELFYSTAFKPYERAQLEQVQRAAQLAFGDLNETQQEVAGAVDNLHEAITLPVVYIRRLIKFLKAIDSFACLQLVDQVSVLKLSCFSVGLIRTACLYNAEQDGFHMIQNESKDQTVFVSLKLLDEWKSGETARLFRDFFYSLKKELHNDPNIRHILMAKYIFKHSWSSTSCPEAIRYRHHHYSHLLRRYLEDKYSSVSKADRKYTQLQTVLRPLDSIYSEVRELLAHHAAAQLLNIPQLYVELFDLET